jgi:hypothetical protein
MQQRDGVSRGKSSLRKREIDMLYEIKVFRLLGNKKENVYSIEIQARDPVNAVEKACIRLGPERMAEIRELNINKPKVNRIARNGII